MTETWDDAAGEAINIIFSLILPTGKITIETLREELDDFIHSLYDRRGGDIQAKVQFASLGADALQTAKQYDIELTAKECVRVLIKKQKDYGPENIRRFGRQGLMVRLHDKIARLENLHNSGRQPENESIYDTYLDIVNYTAIGIMWESDNFLLPLKK
jgi:hypothetical protein